MKQEEYVMLVVSIIPKICQILLTNHFRFVVFIERYSLKTNLPL